MLLSLASAACGGAPDAQSGSASEIVDVPQSPVKRQYVGNCTVHATVAWIESLRRAETGTVSNFSEAFVTYWVWLQAIHDGEEKLDGAFVTNVYEQVQQRGLVEEATFGVDARSLAGAQARIEQSLASGALASRSARSDVAAVRRVVEDALALTPAARALLTRLFGADLSRTLLQPEAVPRDQRLLRPAELGLGTIDERVVTLADALGRRRARGKQEQEEARDGALAWQFGGDQGDSVEVWREQFQTVKRVLHAGLPVPFSWVVDRGFENRDNGSFRDSQRARVGELESHTSLLDDYEATLPDGRVMHAGSVVTDPTIVEALLRPETKIVFFRLKNSWGDLHLSTGARVGTGDYRGYTDVYWEYLFPGGNGTKRMIDLMLPPKAWLRIVRRGR